MFHASRIIGLSKTVQVSQSNQFLKDGENKGRDFLKGRRQWVDKEVNI